jgi:transcriptional regulator with XRE-family HTH domain
MELPDHPLTQAELARLLGVSQSAISRARARAARGAQPPPAPVNPGAPLLRWRPEELVQWWSGRPARGRPPTRRREEE